MLVPTRRALEKKVRRIQEVLGKSEIELLHKLDQRVTNLEAGIDVLKERMLDGEAMKEFRQIMGVGRAIFKQWRESQGLPGSPLENPPN